MNYNILYIIIGGNVRTNGILMCTNKNTKKNYIADIAHLFCFMDNDNRIF